MEYYVRTHLLWSICENLSIDNYYNNVFNAMTDRITEINQINNQQIISIILFEIKRKMNWDSHKLWFKLKIYSQVKNRFYNSI